MEKGSGSHEQRWNGKELAGGRALRDPPKGENGPFCPVLDCLGKLAPAFQQPLDPLWTYCQEPISDCPHFVSAHPFSALLGSLQRRRFSVQKAEAFLPLLSAFPPQPAATMRLLAALLASAASAVLGKSSSQQQALLPQAGVDANSLSTSISFPLGVANGCVANERITASSVLK